MTQEKKTEIPEDLGVKIGTKEEAFWTGIKKKCEAAVEESKHEIEINEHILRLAEVKIKLETKK